MSLEDDVDFVINREPRCPCVLLLDVSGSMSGEPINALNQGLISLHEDVMKDALAPQRMEIAIVTFGGSVSIVQDFVTMDNFIPPTLTVFGATPMGEAILKGIDMVTERKQKYKESGLAYYRPWLFLITDGSPTDRHNIPKASQLLKAQEEKKGLVFFSVGVNKDADFNTLRELSNRPPMSLKGLCFAELFQWLSASMSSVSSSQTSDEKISIPKPQDYNWVKI